MTFEKLIYRFGNSLFGRTITDGVVSHVPEQALITYSATGVDNLCDLIFTADESTLTDLGMTAGQFIVERLGTTRQCTFS